MDELRIQVKYILRNDGTAEWLTNDSVILLRGEAGVEFLTDGSIKMKVGDGVRTWAELPYIGGSGSDNHVFEVIPNSNESHTEAITRVVGNVELHTGDIAIVKDILLTNADGDINSYSAYVYDTDKANWVAMSGNYNAKNIYFDQNLLFTYGFGKYTPDAVTGSVTIPVADKKMSLYDMFMDSHSTEKNPDIIEPSITSFTASPNVTKEVGTTYDLPSATLKVSTGSYQYGSTIDQKSTGTGIVFSSMKITNDKTADEFTSVDSNNELTGTIASANLSDRTVTDDQIKFTFNATAVYPDAPRYPVTNLGNEYVGDDGSKKNITGKTLTKSATATINGFRPYFYGILNDTDALTSEKVRALTKGTGNDGGNYNSAKTIKININGTTTAKRIAVLIPSSSNRVGITKVMKTDGLATEITGSYVKTAKAVQVADAAGNNPVDYDAYIYQPASIDPAEVHEISLG